MQPNKCVLRAGSLSRLSLEQLELFSYPTQLNTSKVVRESRLEKVVGEGPRRRV